MFAVKGWSVDVGSLKAQTEPFKSKSSAKQNDAQPGPETSRKRKREFNNANAAEQDVGKLWERHVEGKEPSKPKTAKKDRKKQKVDQPSNGDVEEVAGTESGRPEMQEDGEGSTSVKSEKKNKKKALKDGKVPEAAEKKKDSNKNSKVAKATNAQVDSIPPAAPPLPATAKLTPMQSAMRQKLISARFRHLNETLYTAPSTTAVDLFDSNPEMFEDYHAGFRQQVTTWPENPVDKFIATLRERGKVRQQFQKKGSKDKNAQNESALVALPRTHGTAIIADLGCGDARLAHTLVSANDISRMNLKIHSFDLHSPSKLVTKADISSLPMEDGSVDVAIFCLALMGTNWISFIEEAYRILHWKGELWIAEIKSRFGRPTKSGGNKVVEHSVGSRRKAAALAKVKERKQKEQEDVNEQEVLQTEVDGVENKKEETDVSGFIDVLRRRGFVLKEGEAGIDLGNKMFVKMEFIKAAPPTKGKGLEEAAAHAPKGRPKFVEEAEKEISTDDEAKMLKPCLYKLR